MLRPPRKLPDAAYTFDDYKKYVAWSRLYGTYDSRWLRGEPPFPPLAHDDSKAEIVVAVLLMDEETFI